MDKEVLHWHCIFNFPVSCFAISFIGRGPKQYTNWCWFFVYQVLKSHEFLSWYLSGNAVKCSEYTYVLVWEPLSRCSECIDSVKGTAHLPPESGDGSRKDKASGWFVLVVVSAASSLQCLVGWQEGHPVCTHYPKGSLLEQKENQRESANIGSPVGYSGFRMLAVLTCRGVLGCIHSASVVAIFQVKTW